MLFNEPKLLKLFSRLGSPHANLRFSALQRAEIAEILAQPRATGENRERFSALQRAEIAEIELRSGCERKRCVFQCSSTSRNC